MVILSLFSKFTHFPHSLTIKIESQIIVFLWTIFYGAAMLKVPQSYKCRYKKWKRCNCKWGKVNDVRIRHISHCCQHHFWGILKLPKYFIFPQTSVTSSNFIRRKLLSWRVHNHRQFIRRNNILLSGSLQRELLLSSHVDWQRKEEKLEVNEKSWKLIPTFPTQTQLTAFSLQCLLYATFWRHFHWFIFSTFRPILSLCLFLSECLLLIYSPYMSLLFFTLLCSQTY